MSILSKRALLVIDIQKDYFPGYRFPLWNTEGVLENIVTAIKRAQDQGVQVILIQHIADEASGIAPFFNAGTTGAEIHPRIRAAVSHAPIVIKSAADAFWKTELKNILEENGINELLLCGMMTQNCVTHTALSPDAAAYRITVLSDCCTSVTEMVHLIALNALSVRIPLVQLNKIL